MGSIKTILRNIAVGLRSRKGKIGAGIIAGIVVLRHGLEFVHAIETGWRVYHEIPTLVAFLDSPFLEAVLLVIGFAVLCWAAHEGKSKVQKPSIPERLAALEVSNSSSTEALARLTEDHGYTKSAHDRLLEKDGKFWGVAIQLGEEIPNRAIGLAVRHDLVRDAGVLIEVFYRLRSMYGTTAQPAAKPFSDWRRNRASFLQDPIARDWERWADALERHLHTYTQLLITTNQQLPEGELYTKIGSWMTDSSEMTGDALSMHLRAHYKKLCEMRDNYALGWKEEVKPRFTNS